MQKARAAPGRHHRRHEETDIKKANEENISRRISRKRRHPHETNTRYEPKASGNELAKRNWM